MTKKFGRPRKLLLAVASVAVLGGVMTAPVVADWSFWAGDTAQVAWTGGDGINVRSAPGVANSIVTTLPEATPLSILDGPLALDDGSGWYEISVESEYGWISGWVSADYVGAPGSTVNTYDDSYYYTDDYYGPPPTPDDVASYVPLWVNTGGGDLNIRSAPGEWADIVGSAPDGASIEVLGLASWDEAGNAWTPVRYGGVTGYAFTAHIGISFIPPAGEYAAVELSGTGGLAAGSAATVTDGVNMRAWAGTDSPIVSTVMAGRTVTLLDGPAWDGGGDEWYQVEVDGITGWVYGAYLSAGSATYSYSSTGDALVNAALAYQGVPYVWGGTAPDGFDCSGFTWYIINQVLGGDYPRPMEDQVLMGDYVDPSELMPGDVIYFQNTYQYGLSHVGFYMGNGQFVHAGTENAGVGIGNLYDPYWQSRYSTARRVH